MNISVQKSASIEPRTDLTRFGLPTPTSDPPSPGRGNSRGGLRGDRRGFLHRDAQGLGEAPGVREVSLRTCISLFLKILLSFPNTLAVALFLREDEGRLNGVPIRISLSRPASSSYR